MMFARGTSDRRASRRARFAAAGMGLAFSALACGSGSATPGWTYSPAIAGASPSPAASEAPSETAATIVLSLKEYSITPATVTLKAGTPVTFAASNEGTINHALVISGSGVSLSTKDLSFGAGTTETIAATLAAGTYTFICPVDGHASQGMMGTITVTP